MKNPTILFLTIFLLSSLAVAGQTPPPPVAIKTQGLTYESAEGGFRVDIPAKPTIQSSPVDAAFGKSQVTSVTLSTSFAFYSVVFLDFPTQMTDRFDLNIRLDAMRDGQVKRLGARVAKDSEYLFGSHYGRENVFETVTETTSSRTFFAGPRLFSISIVTKGKLSSQSEVLRRGNQQRIDKFFDSFQITKIPDAKQEVTELPADFSVSIENGRFSSKFLGISLTAPSKWTLLDQEESATVMELGKESIKKKNETLAERFEDKNARALAMFSNSPISQGVPDAVLVLMAEKAPFPGFLPSAVAKTYLQLFLETGETVAIEPTPARFGGIDFSFVETYRAKTKLRHRIYFANVKGISFEITMTYRDPANLKAMLSAAESLSKDAVDLNK